MYWPAVQLITTWVEQSKSRGVYMKLEERRKGNTARVDPRKRRESVLDVNDCDDDTEEEIDSRAETCVHYIDIGLGMPAAKTQ